MSGTTPECSYIGGHAEGFDPECAWCHRNTLVERTMSALEGVTSGPWEVDESDPGIWSPEVIVVGNYTARDDFDSAMWEDGKPADLAFIAAARSLVPELLAAVQRADDLIAEFRRRDESATQVIERLRRTSSQVGQR